MDDFLHNLRSGKLKQPDRGRRDYQDYKGPQRRAGNERRRTDYYAKVTGENFALVKDALGALAEQQKRIADALAARTKAESRIADALETIAAKLATPSEEAVSPASEQAALAENSSPPVDVEDEWRFSGSKLAHQDRPRLIQLIATLRADGLSWEKIARQMTAKQVPTVSGKGNWRGTAVKKFWDAHS